MVTELRINRKTAVNYLNKIENIGLLKKNKNKKYLLLFE